ncbi:MAG TPA: DUF58 domain-containing protein [Vicinamibacterales bacterium]|nr:DUF58 domain-containing protein [Vicinamibacterales bacterium]
MTRSGSGATPEALPVPSSQLDRFRLRLRQRDRGTVAGAHLIRQRGQSLEFREFRPYLPGDDIRHVDWRASARHHRRDELVVRTFEHEVQTRVVISLDTRATMRLPEVAPKLQLARWFAEAMCYIAGRSGDSVAVHALDSGQVVELGSSADRWRIRRALQRVSVAKAASNGRSLSAEGRTATVNWTALERALPPGSVWLVLTDLYFAGEAEVMALAARVRNAQQGSRWVVVVDFDSWACETHRVGHGLRRLDGPGVSAPELRVKLTSGLLDEVKGRIDERKRRFDRAASAGGYDRLRWTWPAEADPTPTAIFREHFFGQEIVRRLVMPDGAR